MSVAEVQAVEASPRIIALSSSLCGADGRWAGHPGHGAQGQALSGIRATTVWPDRDPATPSRECGPLN
jgi:benzylsuccinate CoA-transferase BbsF subunit